MSRTVQGDTSSQIWLPNMKVWARMPDRCAIDTDKSPVMRHTGDTGGGAAAAQQRCGPASHTAMDLRTEIDSDAECLEPDNPGDEEESGLPTCPICLGEILGRWDRAVVISCMHVFCLACLSRWSALKRTCPLCKSRIQGYMYNIVSETDYSEQMLPATPPRVKEPSPPIAARPAGARAIIDEAPAQRRAAQQGQAPSTAYRSDRPLVSSHAGDPRAVFRQSSNPQSNEWVHGVWPPRRAARQRQATTSNSQQRSEPRPYFYRVQAQAQSQAQAAARDCADVTRSPQDAAEAWRRHIYVESLYAQPMERGPAITVPPIMPEERKQHRLEAWVDRELRALLQTDDVAIVRAYVMGLVRGIGFVRQQEDTEGSGEQAVGSARTDATAALKPFLHEYAAHFWHELRCFAAVSVSMQTYDRLVVYSPWQSPDAHDSQPSTTSASPSTERHLSRSQERSPRERGRQPARSSRAPMEQVTLHAQSRPASVGAQPTSSVARQGQATGVRAGMDVTTSGEHSHGRTGRGSEGGEPHPASHRKRRRLFFLHPSAHVEDQSRPCTGHSRHSDRSQEGADGWHCLFEPAQHCASTGVALRCSGSSGSSIPSSSSTGYRSSRHRDKGQQRSIDGSKLGTQLPRGSLRSVGPERHAEASRSSSSGSDVLAELRVRALAAVRAHREPL